MPDEPAGGVEVLLVLRDHAKDAGLAVVQLVGQHGEWRLRMRGREEHVPAAVGEHRQALGVRRLVPDRGDHSLGAPPAGQLLHASDRIRGCGVDELVSAHALRAGEAVGIDLAHDHASAMLLGGDEVHEAHHARAEDHDVLADVDAEDARRVQCARERLRERGLIVRRVAHRIHAVRRVRFVLGEAARPPRLAVADRTGLVLLARPVLAGQAPVALAA